MSLNKLIGGDCGGNNSLVQLSNIVSRDGAFNHHLSSADKFVNEFMGQNSRMPQTFNMNELLNNVTEIQTSSKQTSQSQVMKPITNYTIPMSSGASSSFMPSPFIQRPFQMPSQLLQMPNPSNVQVQFVDESEVTTSEADVRAKAQEYVEGVKDDDELAYNQFMSFMKKISSGELNLGDTESLQRSKDELLDEMAEKYKDEWDKLSNVTNYWESESVYGIPEEYTFTEGNVMLENKTALEIGKEKLKMGDIPGAVLCFEAASQQQPDSAEAWFLLGTTQAENENDPLAITALKKSLQIDPKQLEAYITLAAAYTNENMPKFAFLSLLDWLRASPKYSDLLPRDVDPKLLDNKELQNYVKSLYLKAAQLNPSQIDANVQNALGVVFNISQEYDKAVDCFKTALMVASDDSKLWNRLGATLANSERSEEAVDAYHEALNLEPGFIRARYNVGITCMNLGAYKQAAEHFLVALNQQCKAKSMYPDSSTANTTSSTIWTTLRMVCSFIGEHEIAEFVDERNLNELNKYFEIEQ